MGPAHRRRAHVWLSGVHFYVPTSPGMAVDYAFCIGSLAFLDASGHEITP